MATRLRRRQKKKYDGGRNEGKLLYDVQRRARIGAVRETLMMTGGDVRAAAEILGVTRMYIHAIVTKTEMRGELWEIRELNKKK